MYNVYCCTCKETGMSYIGVTNNIRRRWIEHKNVKPRKMLFHKAIDEYGQESFVTKILHKTEDRNLAFEKEQEFIKELETRHPNGYNKTKGGLGHTGCVSPGMSGMKHTEKTRMKMRLSRPNQSGSNNPMYGKHLSKERKRQISEHMKGNKYAVGIVKSEDTIEKLRKAVTGRKHKEEAIEKMRIARKRYWENKREESRGVPSLMR